MASQTERARYTITETIIDRVRQRSYRKAGLDTRKVTRYNCTVADRETGRQKIID